jgi:hypothetical protein
LFYKVSTYKLILFLNLILPTMKKKIIPIFFVISIFQYACEMQEISITDINLSQTNHQYKIVVDCFITTENKYHYIKLSTPGNYAQNMTFEPLSGAGVRIISNNLTYNFSETDVSGIYKSNQKFAPEIGQTYSLIIKYDNIEYTANETVEAVNDINFSEIKLPKKNTSNLTPGQSSFIVWKHDFGYNENAKWLWLSAWEWDSLGSYSPFSAEKRYNYTHEGGEPQGLFAYHTFGNEVSGQSQDSLKVFKYSVSEGYSEYLYALFCETDWQTGVFSTIPANLPTNISNNAVGYFYIMDVDYQKIKVEDL